MVGKRNRLVYTIILAILIVIPLATAQDFLAPIFKPFEGTNIAQTYNTYYPIIDAILYFLLFIGLAKTSIGDKFKGMVPTVMGIILAVGMCVFEYTSHFNLGKLAPLAALIFFLILGTAVYNWIKNILGGDAPGATWTAFSVAFLIIYGVINYAAPEFLKWAYKTDWVSTIVSLGLMASIVGLLMGVVKLFKNISNGDWTLGRAGSQDRSEERAYRAKERQEAKALDREKKAAEDLFKLDTEIQNIGRNIAQAQSLEANLYNKDLTDRKEQVKVLSELAVAINGSLKLQAQVEQGYANASKYADNPQYLETLKSASKQLHDFVGKINNLLSQLQNEIKNTKDIQLQDETIGKNLDNYIKNLEATLTNYSSAALNIDSQIAKQNAITGVNTSLSTETLNALKNQILQRAELFAKIKDIQLKIKDVRDRINKNDTDNISDIERSLLIIQQNSSQDNVSGESLRQIYQAVNNIHQRLQETVSKLVIEEKNHILEKNAAIKRCGEIRMNERLEVVRNINKEIESIKKDLNMNTDILKEFFNHALAWQLYMQTNKGKSRAEKSAACMNLPPSSPDTYKNQSLMQQLEKYHMAFGTLSDSFTIKKFIVSKRELLVKVIKYYNDITIGSRSESDQRAIEDMKKILESIDAVMQAEKQKASSIEQLLKLERELAINISTNNQNTASGAANATAHP